MGGAEGEEGKGEGRVKAGWVERRVPQMTLRLPDLWAVLVLVLLGVLGLLAHNANACAAHSSSEQ